ncbi:MAG: arginine--tRNA ligase, partial [Cyclobacteriaceae bacterium]
FYFESDTYLLGKDIVEEGLEKGVFYKKDDGSVWCDLTDVGLDNKLVLRSDGTSVYMTQDMGTADLKYDDYGMKKSLYVVGNEQDYHFKVLFAILDKLGRPYAKGLHHLSYGMVDLPSGKMKSREGTVVDADDLMSEMVQTAAEYTRDSEKIKDFTDEQEQQLHEMVAMSALKFYLLKVDPKKRMLFNPEESIDFHGHTGPFVQYTYARTAALGRKAAQVGLQADAESLKAYDQLQPAEQEVIRLLTLFPERVNEAAAGYSPATIAQYVYDLAKEYNRFYSELSVFQADDEEVRAFRVALTGLTGRVIKEAMELLGITVPEKM